MFKKINVNWLFFFIYIFNILTLSNCPLGDKKSDKKSNNKYYYTKNNFSYIPKKQKLNNVTIGSYEDYENEFKTQKYETEKHNPFYFIFGLYNISKNKNLFFKKYNEIRNKYVETKRNEAYKREYKSNGFYDYVYAKEIKMLENIISLEEGISSSQQKKIIYNKNAKIYEYKVAISSEDIENISVFLKNGKNFEEKTNEEYYSAISNCFFMLLESKINKVYLGKIKNKISECLEKKSEEIKPDQILVNNRKPILEEFHKICLFHNLTFKVLSDANKENVFFDANDDIAKYYDKMSEILNKIYKKIIILTNNMC